jgi:hypothetical protein
LEWGPTLSSGPSTIVAELAGEPERLRYGEVPALVIEDGQFDIEPL